MKYWKDTFSDVQTFTDVVATPLIYYQQAAEIDISQIGFSVTDFSEYVTILGEMSASIYLGAWHSEYRPEFTVLW